jgi:excisionase family DNA binding protein
MTNCTDSRVAYSPVEVAKMLGVSHDTLHRWWKRGEGPPRLEVGGRVLVPKQALEEWLKEQATLPGNQ